MDLHLPAENGFRPINQTRTRLNLNKTLVAPVTALDSLEELEKARNAGFDGFLAKPVDVRKFRDQIRRILKGEPVWSVEEPDSKLAG